MRHDIMMLDLDDLAALSNRGNVKRASKELERGELRHRIRETEGDVTVEWSDGVTCNLPADRVVSAGRCTCPATRICRHIVRSVLAYQAAHADDEMDDEAPASRPVQTGPWDPGALRDDVLAQQFTPHQRRRASTMFDDNLVVELVRGRKPTARFHRLGHTVRFLVNGDARYTRCDCAAEAPCLHALLAIYAFRHLAESDDAGIIEVGEPPPLPSSLLEDAEDELARLLAGGLAAARPELLDRLRSREHALRDVGAIWIAEILSDLRKHYDFYHRHDARFAPETVVDLLGEFVIRADALRQRAHHDVPSLFISGAHGSDQNARLGQSRLIGLGTLAHMRKDAVEVTALVQDVSSGRIAGLRHTFVNEEMASTPLHILGRRPVIRGRSLEAIGAGQLVLKSATLCADHELTIGRSTASIYAQNYRWNELAAPVQADSFAEICARLSALPPASLRPRRLGEDLQVCAITAVESAHFDPRTQSVVARVVDANGDHARIVHPYSDAGADGVDALLQALTTERLVFIAGRVSRDATGLRFAPSGLIFERQEQRFMLQPWLANVDDRTDTTRTKTQRPASDADTLTALRSRAHKEVGEVAIVGSAELTGKDTTRLKGLEREAAALGLDTLARALGALRKGDEPARALLACAMVIRLMDELG